MASPRRLIKPAWLALLAASAPAQSAELELRLERMAMPGVQVEGVAVVVDWPARRAPQGLHLRIDRLVVDTPSLELRALVFRCGLLLDAPDGPLCEGPASWRDTAGMARTAMLRLQPGQDALHTALSVQGVALSLVWPFSDDAPLGVGIDRMPATWLQGMLDAMWPGARLTEGVLGGRFELAWDQIGTLTASGRLRATGLGLDTDDGSVAAAGVGAQGTLALAVGEHIDLRTDLTIEGGELLFDTFYAELPARPVQLALRAREETGGRWRIDDLTLADRDVFDLRGELGIAFEGDDWLQRADLRLKVTDAEEGIARYAGSLLGLAGMAGLRAEGGLDAALRLDERGLRALELDMHDLYVVDPGGRFGFDAVSGVLSLGPDSTVRETGLRWASASLYRIELGALNLSLRSGRDSVELTVPAAIDLLGGRLALERLRWRLGRDEQVDFAASMTIDGLDLRRLTEAFGWPQFGGKLSGRIPAVRYDEGVLSFDGGLEVGVFDGRVDIDSLSLERPFGVLPTMNADIRFSGLDLQQITQVFDLGEIQGRLRGHMLGMRLIDWEPVAFDAVLRTEKGAGTRRISQRAVDSLTSIGGGGAAAALQSTVLRMFSTFAYDEIGMSCRLRNHVCHMDGIDSVGDGYAIVKGSGLPRISVVGHQRQVDWPVLLARLQVATSGAGPVMN
ncbi:MAG TPA: hypothetical protein PKZ76_12010 [Xanthomonadaceae bacterium]|nr:hypothetical protein [Xanthomonadaceae bacterium]